jgi:hypothetical protein
LRGSLVLVAALAACSGPAVKSDWERQHERDLAPEEAPVVLPAYPGKVGLIEFKADAADGFRFFVDPATLSVGADGEVRYVLVARSTQGAENVSFEGMRCNSAELRLYAFGRDGAWAGTPGAWRSLQERGVQRWHRALFREYFCPLKDPIANAREGVQALRDGGHPAVKGLTGDIPRGF